MPQPNRRVARAAQPALPTSIEVHFSHASEFRVVHADGAWGGVTPQGNVSMAFYAEYRQTPEKIVYDVPAGLEPVITVREDSARRIGPQPLMREIQVNIIMTEKGAAALSDWLLAKLSEIKVVRGEEGRTDA